MTNEKILAQKKDTVSEITNKIKDSSSVVFVDYRGLTVTEMNELREKLKKVGSELKIYKNTLTKLALDNLELDLDDNLIGPNAISFSSDIVEPIKIITNYAKEHTVLEVKTGIIDGKVSSKEELEKLATIPSREGLLTMLAGGMIGIAKDLSICLNLYSEQKGE